MDFRGKLVQPNILLKGTYSFYHSVNNLKNYKVEPYHVYISL